MNKRSVPIVAWGPATSISTEAAISRESKVPVTNENGQAESGVKWAADGFTASKTAQHVFYAVSFAWGQWVHRDLM